MGNSDSAPANLSIFTLLLISWSDLYGCLLERGEEPFTEENLHAAERKILGEDFKPHPPVNTLYKRMPFMMDEENISQYFTIAEECLKSIGCDSTN